MTILLFDGMSVLKTTPMNMMNMGNGVLFSFIRTIKADIAKVQKQFKGEKVSALVCWEGSIRSKQDLIPSYKGTREPSRDVFREGRRAAQELLPHLGVSQAVHPDWEADDLLAYFAGDGERTVIRSGDHDLRQTVSANNFLLQKQLGKKKGTPTRMSKLAGPPELMTLENFYVRTGYKNPVDFVTAKILLGDGSDELKGMPGIGKLTIQKYLYDATWTHPKRAEIDAFLASEYGQNLRTIMTIPGKTFDPDRIRFTPHQRNSEVAKRLLTDAGFGSVTKDFWTWWKPFSDLD